MLHACYLVIEDCLKPFGKKLSEKYHIQTKSFGYRFIRVLLANFLIIFSYIFFRSDTVSDAFSYIHLMFTRPDFWVLNGDALFTYGLNVQETFILLAAIGLLLFADLILVRKKERLDVWLSHQWVVFRVLFVLGIIVYTVVFGEYGPGFNSKQFIYFQF